MTQGAVAALTRAKRRRRAPRDCEALAIFWSQTHRSYLIWVGRSLIATVPTEAGLREGNA